MAALALLVLFGLSAALNAADPAAEDAVATYMAILIGFPSAEAGPAGERAQVVPGSIVLLESDTSAPRADQKEGLAKARAFTNIVEKLWSTFRLDPLRKQEKGQFAAMALNRPVDLPPLPESGIRITATLQKFDGANAVYRVQLFQGNRSLADSTHRIGRGGRAIVGGMGGAQAPYVFLVLEPQDPAASARLISRMGESPGLTMPRVLKKVMPKYPQEAKERGISGTVVLQAQVSADGGVEDIRVMEYPDPALADAAVEAVKQWTYEPARLESGKAVSVICSISLVFALR